MAALCSIAAGASILLSPGGVYSKTAAMTTAAAGRAGTAGQATVDTHSWFEVRGVWGAAPLAAFAALYSRQAALSQRGQAVAVAAFGCAGVILTGLAGISVGLVYPPAALVTLLAVLLMAPLAGLKRRRPAAGS